MADESGVFPRMVFLAATCRDEAGAREVLMRAIEDAHGFRGMCDLRSVLKALMSSGLVSAGVWSDSYLTVALDSPPALRELLAAGFVPGETTAGQALARLVELLSEKRPDQGALADWKEALEALGAAGARAPAWAESDVCDIVSKASGLLTDASKRDVGAGLAALGAKAGIG